MYNTEVQRSRIERYRLQNHTIQNTELQVSSYRATQILVNYRATGQVYSHIATQLQIYKKLQDAKVQSKVTGYRIFLEKCTSVHVIVGQF